MNNTKIKIQDKKLAKSIRMSLDIRYRRITVSDMEQLKKLELYGISDISGLEHAVNLKELTIGENSITDFNVIAKLTNLRKLHIRLNSEFDMSIISKLPHLREIYLSWKYVKKFITPYENKTKISYSSLLNKVFEVNKFTNKQKLLVEKYLFNPTIDNAIEAIRTTPKASIFVMELLGEDMINQIIKETIQDPKVNIRYLKELVKDPVYKKIFEEYVCESGSKKSKKFLMEYSLDRDSVMGTNFSFVGCSWYRAKIAKGYIL
ncbi:hypothetical protein [uncultured Clostridium sp.]|uniref:hypothetical protein n=1 Tax=uncultured Clostridium sp. TaxID=59620 RepID=UPI0025E14DFE|nr:hypothetical protein [uncultured Clostridium sp.]